MKKLLLIPMVGSSIYGADNLAILDNITSANYSYEPHTYALRLIGGYKF